MRSIDQVQIETFHKIVVALDGILIVVSIVEELSRIEVDDVDAKVKKIVELYEALIVHVDEGAVVANSIVEEVSCNSVDEVLDTSIEVS